MRHNSLQGQYWQPQEHHPAAFNLRLPFQGIGRTRFYCTQSRYSRLDCQIYHLGTCPLAPMILYVISADSDQQLAGNHVG